MKKLLFLLFTITILFTSSCKKDDSNNQDDNNNIDPTSQFVRFDMDGVIYEEVFDYFSPVTFDKSISTSVYNIVNVGMVFEMDIDTDIDENDNMSAAFMEGMVDSLIPLNSCIVNDDCAWDARIIFSFDGSEFDTNNTVNELPNQYIKIKKVIPYSLTNVGGYIAEFYLLEGEFEALVRTYNGSEANTVTNGEFRLIFSNNYF